MAKGFSQMLDYARDSAILSRYERAGAMEAESERIFVPQRLWNAYFNIRALHGRIAYLFQKSFEENHYRDWRSDSGADQLLKGNASSERRRTVEVQDHRRTAQRI
jgi:hypothetical protein